MALLALPAIDICYHTNKLIYQDVESSSSKVEVQVLTFVAVELSLIDDNADLLRKPSWLRPQLLRLGTVHSGIQHKYWRHGLYGLPCRKLLITFASITPSSCLILSFNTGFQDL